MKKYLPCFILIFITVLFIRPVKAQQKINRSDVKKIILSCGDGGIHTGENITFEVLNEHSNWNSYQTKINVSQNNIHLINRIQIGILTTQQIDEFLKCITTVKPKFDAQALNITATALIAEIKAKAKDTANNTMQLNNVITEAKVQEEITAIMTDVSVDTYSECSIEVVKNNNDTLKIETNHDYATMLPWTINKVNTYDMGINDFFIAAMGNRPYINRDMLGAHVLKEEILSHIDGQYSTRPISTYRLNYCYTDNLKLLKANFSPDFTISNKASFDNTYDLKLKTSAMSSNMHLNAYINLEDRAGILALINYSKRLDQYLRQGSLVLKYYGDRAPYQIGFSYSPHAWINLNIEIAKQGIPALNNVDDSNSIYLWLNGAGKILSEWVLLLPDKRFVMAHRYLNKPGTPFTPVFPPNDPGANGLNSTLKYVMFNADGSVVK